MYEDYLMSIGEQRLEIAGRELGVKEKTGGEEARIIEYDSCTTLKAKEDEVPWCSAFVNWTLKQNGEVGTGLANARSWLDWGSAMKQPVPGCIVVLKRGDSLMSGHVGFYVRDFNQDRIIVLGGNQSDQVKFSNFLKSDVLGYRG